MNPAKISSSQCMQNIPKKMLIVWSFSQNLVFLCTTKLTWKKLPKFQHILNNLQYLAWKAWSVSYGVAGHVRGEISGEEVFSSCGHTRHKHGPWGGVGRCYVSGSPTHPPHNQMNSSINIRAPVAKSFLQIQYTSSYYLSLLFSSRQKFQNIRIFTISPFSRWFSLRLSARLFLTIHDQLACLVLS